MTLPYAVDDDRAAIEAVSDEVKRPNAARWQAMTGDDERLLQTYRVLGLLIKRAEVPLVQRRAELRAFQGTRREREHAAAEYEEWKATALHFINAVRQRRDELRPRIAQAGRDRVVEELKATLRSLARAIDDHRDAITGGEREPTTADRMLWVRLDLLPHLYDDRAPDSTDGLLRAGHDAHL